uniref:NAD(P)-binding domain-containing protein n=1 Tax=viral metagenome TaxID=1070528 RepID=A0A6C0FB78_9ZZZZ|tara:strand:- start:6616 stop:8451 length:1836 start_codon:yes stop_codon:yes gene_type:complete
MYCLIYGSKGWIGTQFTNLLDEHNISYSCGKSRIDDYTSTLSEILSCSPTHIISFTGRTHGENCNTIDYLEQKGKLVENIKDNLFGPIILSEIAKERNIHLTYLGTGCIFTYDDNHLFESETFGFTESDLPNFFGSSYSVVKGFTDRFFHLQKHVLNLRIRMPITDNYNPRNFITKITHYKHICSIANSMTVLPDLLPCVIELMKKNITGTLNLTNPGLISHNEILDMYKEIVDPSFEYQNFSLEEQHSILSSERSNNYLDTSKLSLYFPEVLHIKDSVRNCLIKYKHHIQSNGDILITGGCGFIGSNFINMFFPNMQFDNLINIDALYYAGNESNINMNIRNNTHYIFFNINITDNTKVSEIFSKFNITHIIHFAAQSHVDNSFSNPLQYSQDNIIGTHTLLDICYKHKKLIKFIHISTDEVYGQTSMTDSLDIKTEHSMLCPTNPYSATKAAAEMLVHSYYYSFKLPMIITRGNNVYGPNQYPEKLIPKFITQLLNDEKVTIHGDGCAIRSFIYVSDVVNAIIYILNKGKIGEIYNIGGDNNSEYSVINIAKLLIEKIKKTTNFEEWMTYISDRPFNDQRYSISNKKLLSLGWKQQVSLLDGISKILKI